jgi:hypothetical protein
VQKANREKPAREPQASREAVLLDPDFLHLITLPGTPCAHDQAAPKIDSRRLHYP